MWGFYRKNSVFNFVRLVALRRGLCHNRLIVKEEVRAALDKGNPVVALESTIITHGMPYPDNVKCALEVEKVVRNQGAIPATLAIIGGRIKVGLEEKELAELGDVGKSQPFKTSRRDFSYVISNKLNGGTTVSGTLIIAKMAEIPVFATGGIGGVHRKGEITFDISADLNELGRSNVAVVSSGIKSILDIPKTLEYLETQGVFVAAFANGRDFPAFYSRKSGCFAPYAIPAARQAAKLIQSHRRLGLESGMLFAVPVPEEFALEERIIDEAIEQALEDAEREGIAGKEITPFLLNRIGEISGGKSLETNIALIKNNAKVAAEISVELSNLRREDTLRDAGGDFRTHNSPVVIGGSNLDCAMKLQESEIKLDGRIHFGKAQMFGGGVGRNIYEALSKLGARPIFITVLGDDTPGQILNTITPADNRNKIRLVKGASTAQCTVVFDRKGECKFLAGDMGIHAKITPEIIAENEDLIKTAPLVVIDGNLSVSTIDHVLGLANLYNVPVLYEPTDVEISIKPFKSKHAKAIKFITPNLAELKYIASFLKIATDAKSNENVHEGAELAAKLVDYVDNVIVTMGHNGVIIARRGAASEPFLESNSIKALSVRHYPAEILSNVVNVSGAGDCLASGIMSGILKGLSEEECIAKGFGAARASLLSPSSVPSNLELGVDCRAFYHSLK